MGVPVKSVKFEPRCDRFSAVDFSERGRLFSHAEQDHSGNIWLMRAFQK